MNTSLRRIAFSLCAATAFALAIPASAAAQHIGLRPRWQAWLGCWSAAPAELLRETGPEAPRIVCITPTADGDVVDISAVAEGKVVSRDRIDASGTARAIDAGGCNGSQRARWSDDGRRVFLTSAVTCDGKPTEMSAILALASSGEWLDVRRVAAGEGSDVRVARYHDVGLPSSVPVEITRSFDGRNAIMTRDARAFAAAPVGASAVIEATHATDPSVVEAWVVESGQRFAVDARSLAELADAGVPGRVTDAMISVSRPTDVATSPTVFYSPYGWNGRNDQYGRGSADAWDQGTGSRVYVSVYEYDPWGWGYGPFANRFAAPPFGYGDRYGAGNSFGDGYGIGYGFGYENHNRYRGSPGSRQGYYYPPVIVLHNDPSGTAPRGQSVKGEGYTQDVRRVGAEPRRAVPRTPEARREPVASPREVPAPRSQPSREGAQRTARARP